MTKEFYLSRNKKILIGICADSFLVISSIFLAFSLRLGHWYFPTGSLIYVTFFAPVLAIPVFASFGFYKNIIRFFGFKYVWQIFKGVALFSLLWGLIAYLSSYKGIPRSVIIINGVFLLFFILNIRFFTKWAIKKITSTNDNLKKVIIYGAGVSGRQVSRVLTESNKYKIVSYIDDSEKLHGTSINGINIFSKDKLSYLIEKFQVIEVLVVMPSIPNKSINEIVKVLQKFPVIVRVLPSIEDFVKNKTILESFRKIKINELLGRVQVEAKSSLLKKNIFNKVVCISGAGGSIGSELARQSIKLGAKKVILIENAEFNLYSISKELEKSNKIVPVLESVLNVSRVSLVLKKYKVETVFHAAAYKHVPIIEYNPVPGVENNIIGTFNFIQACKNSQIKNFVLISTDKAVNPTNIMGATKRFSEKLIISFAEQNQGISFSIVRFGNVLGSSGSVIPLFNKQIENGGPVTITHKNIVRYFMTIHEAVELVIQASALSKETNIYTLDMGKQMKIYDLAIKMIHLKGLEVKEEGANTPGIEIKITGLRPGEKLYEELQINKETSPTSHSRIFIANEPKFDSKQLSEDFKTIKDSISKNDYKTIELILTKNVEGFKMTKLQKNNIAI